MTLSPEVYDQVKAKAEAAEQKFELIDVLWESLEAEATTITNEQRVELNYRLARYEQNPLDVVPWEEVRATVSKNQ